MNCKQFIRQSRLSLLCLTICLAAILPGCESSNQNDSTGKITAKKVAAGQGETGEKMSPPDTSPDPFFVENNTNLKPAVNESIAVKENITPEEFKTIEWTDLMPKDDLDALLNPPKSLFDIPDGSDEDQIGGKLANSKTANKEKDPVAERYQQALTSERILPEFDGRKIKLAGYIVPLDFDDKQALKDFFFVPYFGACIHVPPPPPNQLIYAKYPQGLKQKEFYEPVWLSGTVKVETTENDMGTAAYSMTVEKVEVYVEEEYEASADDDNAETAE
ncbi:MAG: DUF3299 domain-containing protein [bacterium]|nr:DUF3299 domain-containing protein [bacterium]